MTSVPEEYVTAVIAGHTFRTASGRGPVRLADVVVPELGEAGAERARRNLESLVQGKWVRIKLRVFDGCTLRTADVWYLEDGVYQHVNALVPISYN